MRSLLMVSSLVLSTAVSARTVGAQFTVPNTFTSGTAAKASEVNANFAAIINALNAIAGQSCPPGQFLTGMTTAGIVTCAAPVSANPTMLPAGATMRGIWGSHGSLAVPVVSNGTQIATISFPLTFPGNPTFSPVTNWLIGSATTANCPGYDVNGLPQAAAGHLCIYQSNPDVSSNVQIKTAQWGRLGVRLILTGQPDLGYPVADGSWAATAPLP